MTGGPWYACRKVPTVHHTMGGLEINTKAQVIGVDGKVIPGLYAAGEVLDIDGDCGGYNLQWAWSSGHLAGQLRP